MFVEKLTKNDFKELAKFITKNAFEFSRTGDFTYDSINNLHDYVEEKELKLDDSLFLCDCVKVNNYSDNRKQLYVGGCVIDYGFWTGWMVSCLNNYYKINDFDIKWQTGSKPIIYELSDVLLKKSYISYMSKKFGKEYTAAYKNHQEKSICKE